MYNTLTTARHGADAPRSRLARQLIFAAACAVSTAAWADCESRKARPAETAFHARAMAALVAALPPVPAGVTEVDAKAFDFKNPPAIHEVLCDFSKEGDFSILAKRQYLRKHSPAEQRQLQAQYDALTAQFHALRKTPPEKAAEQQALRQRSNAAWQATRDAEKAGDKAAAQARDAEYRTLRNQADAIDAQHLASVKAQTDEFDKRRIGIDLVAQKVDVVIGMNLQRLPAARPDKTSAAWGAASPGKSAGLKVHNVGFSVGGTDGPLRQALAAAIDRARLQALVGKPLPGEAESEAFATQAVPTSVPEIAADVPTGAAPGIEPTGARAATPAPAQTPATERPVARAVPVAASTPTDTPAATPVKQATDAVNKLRGLFGR